MKTGQFPNQNAQRRDVASLGSKPSRRPCVPSTNNAASPIYNASVTDLKGKTIFITGAARRLGKAIALAMAQAGANVAFTYRSSASEAAQTLKEIQSTGVQALAFECDLRRPECAKDAV